MPSSKAYRRLNKDKINARNRERRAEYNRLHPRPEPSPQEIEQKAAERLRKRREGGAKWRKENPDYLMNWYWKNREAQKIKRKRSYEEHREERILNAKIWTNANRDRANATRRKRYAEHPENRANSGHVRRVNKRATAVDCSAKIAILHKERFCHWCCCRMTRSGKKNQTDRTIDHVVPLKRGGKHVPDNLVASCTHCNCSRQNKLVDEWLPYAKFNSNI